MVLVSSINGVHLIIESQQPDADAAFFRDILGLRHVDAGNGFLIFRLPPAEAAFHPVDLSNDDKSRNEIFLMCGDLKKEISNLQSKGIKCGEPENARWGTVTK